MPEQFEWKGRALRVAQSHGDRYRFLTMAENVVFALRLSEYHIISHGMIARITDAMFIRLDLNRLQAQVI